MARKKANKSQAIREFKSSNPQAGPTEIATALGKRKIKVSPAQVSNVLSTSKRKKKRAAPKKKRGAKKRGRKPAAGRSNLDQVKAAAKFISEVGNADAAVKAIRDAEDIRKALG